MKLMVSLIIGVLVSYFSSTDGTKNDDYDIIKYKKAVEYINKSKEAKNRIKGIFNRRKALKCKVSNKIILKDNYLLFNDQLSKADSSIHSDITWLQDSLKFEYLNQLSINGNSRYTLFFTAPYNKYLMAVLVETGVNNDHYSKNMNKVAFLFEYNENNEILNVILKSRYYY